MGRIRHEFGAGKTRAKLIGVMTGRPAPSSVHGQASRLRIAVTLEQCWHRVPGGTARAALDTVESIRAAGTVELIGVAARHRAAPPEPWVPTIPVGLLPLPRAALYETWHRFGWPAVEGATGPVDVIHVTGLAMPPKTAPLVATLHDLAFVHHPEYFTAHGLRFFAAALERMRRDADLVLCSSDTTRADAEAAGFAADRLRVVPLGVAAPDGGPDHADTVRRRLGIEGRFVVHLGTREPRKNTAALLRVAPQLPDDVTVVLAGGSGWGDAPDTSAAPRVRDLGFVSEADKWALLAAATVCCVPSLWEGFGLPALEAMAVGTPVVTSAGTSLAEVVGDAGICVDPRDDDALATALRSVLDDPATAAGLARRGRRRAAAFTWERTAAATLQAYEEVAST